MLLGYCNPNTGGKRRGLVLPSALIGCLVREAMMYCVVANTRSLSDADRNWYGPVSNVIRCLDVLMALLRILHGYSVVNVEGKTVFELRCYRRCLVPRL